MKTILLIDDDPQVLATYSLALERGGYRVILAASGTEGLEMARKHLPDLILSDIHMPGGDGSTLLRDIRRDPELRLTQVVLITGRPDLVTPRRGMEDGADDFLVKPFGVEALLNCIEARFRRAAISWRVEDQVLAKILSSIPTQLSHEFFTPLAGIMGLMEILQSDYASLAPREIQDIHHDIYQSALRLHRTLRNYLLILDLQSCPSESNAKPLPAAELRSRLQAGIDEALRQHKRREDTTLQVESGPISILPEDLTRVAEELVDNAYKFSRTGTPVDVKLGADGCLTVTDQGRGLPPDEITRIGMFQQFDRKKHEQQGLGLGLVLVQKLAAQYGAEFSISSKSGEGTKVSVAFRLAEKS